MKASGPGALDLFQKSGQRANEETSTKDDETGEVGNTGEEAASPAQGSGAVPCQAWSGGWTKLHHFRLTMTPLRGRRTISEIAFGAIVLLTRLL